MKKFKWIGNWASEIEHLIFFRCIFLHFLARILTHDAAFNGCDDCVIFCIYFHLTRKRVVCSACSFWSILVLVELKITFVLWNTQRIHLSSVFFSLFSFDFSGFKETCKPKRKEAVKHKIERNPHDTSPVQTFILILV